MENSDASEPSSLARPRSREGRAVLKVLLDARADPAGSPLPFASVSDGAVPIYGVGLTLFVPERFRSDSALSEITRYAMSARADLVGHFDLPVREAEATIRVALWGDVHLTAHIAPEMLAEIQIALLAHMVRQSRPSERDVIALVSDAEEMVERNGIPDSSDAKVAMRVRLPRGRRGVKVRCRDSKRRWVTIEGGQDVVRGAGMPSTFLGLFFRASVLGQPDQREHWLRLLDESGSVDFPAGVIAIFVTMTRKRFEGKDGHDVACFVRRMYEFYSPTSDRLWPLETEMLMRNALGERVSLEGIGIPESEVKLVVAVSIAWDLGLSVAELDELIVRAERLASERGYALSQVATT